MKIHDIHLDSEYAQWITDIKELYRRAQIKAVVRVNTEQLTFNWQLGRDLVMKRAEEKWGAGVVEQVSLDLKKCLYKGRTKRYGEDYFISWYS